MQETTFRRPKTGQYLCLNCGFQSSATIFKFVKKDGEKNGIVCPDCDSPEVVDADTRVRVNASE
jgi:DNA-directed RNA polymerase subunit RPC12/RpoP